MSLVIYSSALSIGGTPIFIEKENLINVSFQGGVKLSSVPTLYDKEGNYVEPVNLWFIHLLTVKRAKNLNSSIRALQRYWSFLNSNNLIWDGFPKQKALKPTYRFRNENLYKAIRCGELKASTASMYMNHIIKFYEWAIEEKKFQCDENNRPFEIEYLTIKNNSLLGHINRNFIIRSTDLRIKVPNKADKATLKPLSEKTLEIYAKALVKKSWEFRLQQQLQIRCGLRTDEACSFPVSLIRLPKSYETMLEIEIGIFNGVRTKYGKSRVIEMHSNLMRELYKYLISERRLKRSSKVEGIDFEPLLINRYKNPYNANMVQHEFCKIRKEIRAKNIPFDHKTHDLRATYGTYRLASLLKIEELEAVDAMTLLMGWMGHRNEKTTWKYLRYLETDKARTNAMSILDTIMDDALNEK